MNVDEIVINLEEDLSLELESRFVDEFRGRFCKEDLSDFEEGVKWEDMFGFSRHLSWIYRCVKKEVVEKLSLRNVE